MTYEPGKDTNLAVLDAGHFFEHSTTKIGFRRGAYLRGYMYEFIELFARTGHARWSTPLHD